MDTQELELAWRLIAEADAARAAKMTNKEYRLYYRADDGTIVGLWEMDHPAGDYIVLSDPDLFHRQNTALMRVRDNKLIILDPRVDETFRLQKSTQGLAVVAGHAILSLRADETYNDKEYYEPRNN